MRGERPHRRTCINNHLIDRKDIQMESSVSEGIDLSFLYRLGKLPECDTVSKDTPFSSPARTVLKFTASPQEECLPYSAISNISNLVVARMMVVVCYHQRGAAVAAPDLDARTL